MFRKRHPPAGAQPGTLVINSHAPKPEIRVLEYSADTLAEWQADDPRQLEQCLREGSIAWVDVQGLGDEAILRAIGKVFGLHPLALEDVVNVPQRPKVESFPDHTLFITRMARMHDPHTAVSEQLSLIVGPTFVVTFQERPGDILDPVRRRIRQGKGPIRTVGADYLAYAIIDTLIDGYYPILEQFGEAMEALEEEIVVAPEAGHLKTVHHLKRELLAIRRTMWPLREALGTVIREGTPFFSDAVQVYLRDCQDHCVQMIDVVETYRELAGGLMDVYLSSVGNRQNEVMKVLTVMASIFIPLTFLAGIYGMNFDHMPELHAAWGYPVLLGVMVLTAVLMVVFFRRKGWLGSGRSTRPDGHRA